MHIRNIFLQFLKPYSFYLNKCSTLCSDSTMLAWQIHNYESFENLVQENVNIPIITSPHHLLIEVHATSVNPIDLLRLNGYGASLLFKLSQKEGNVNEFPIIPCRDVSGKVVGIGQKVDKFAFGDEIWGAIGAHLPGALAQYILIKQSEISIKPKNLSHIEAASMPYVACTTWAALSKFAALDSTNFKGKKILILGGSGGIGTFACQFSKSLGCHVTTTCSTGNVERLQELNCDAVVDYTNDDFIQQLRDIGQFDIVLDAVGDEATVTEAKKMLYPNSSSLYMALSHPFMSNINNYGLVGGLLSNVATYSSDVVKNFVCNRIKTNWTFFTPSAQMMDKTRIFVENKSIIPIIDEVFSFEEAKLAFEKVSKKHSKGKTVIKIK